MSGESNADFGYSTANIGDVDFDGATDLAVGSPRYGSADQGEIVIMFLKVTCSQSGGTHVVHREH